MTFIKMPHCWEPHVTAHFLFISSCPTTNTGPVTVTKAFTAPSNYYGSSKPNPWCIYTSSIVARRYNTHAGAPLALLNKLYFRCHVHRCITQDGLSPTDHSTEEQLCYDVSIHAGIQKIPSWGAQSTFLVITYFTEGCTELPWEAIGPDGSNCFSRCSVSVCLFVCLFCCFTSQVNSYGHGGTVSSSNHSFFWTSLNKQLTSNLCTYFRL